MPTARLPLLPATLTPATMPRTRADCEPGGRNSTRPCPWICCRHSLVVEGSRTESCSLDVADAGGITLIEIGQLLGLTRERIRQIEAKGLRKLGHKPSRELAKLRAMAES